MRLANESPWAFLSFALPAVMQRQTTDAAMRTLCAIALVKLGMPTPVRVILAMLTEREALEPGVVAVRSAAERLPPDEIPPDRRRALLDQNLAVLRQRVVDRVGEVLLPGADEMDSSMRTWAARVAGTQLCRGPRGHVIELMAPSAGPPRMFDATGLGASPVTPAQRGGSTCPDVLYLAGISSARVLLQAHAEHPRHVTGTIARITAVEPNTVQLLDALSVCDLREALGHPRLDVLIGPGAMDALATLLDQRRGTSIQGEVLGTSELAPVVSRIANHALSAQRTELEELTAKLAARDAARDDAWWAGRWAGRIEPERPLSVLLSTTRFSTFVKHSTADIAEALRRAGSRVDVLIEPDDASRSTNLDLCRRAWALDPDLVVRINFQRKDVLGPLLAGVPFACFIQDRSAQLFTTAAGRALGPRDFTVGHLHPELFEQCGYPRRNTLMFPVPASATKFADAPIDAALLAEHACEIAYVSHQSTPVETFLEDLIAAAPARLHGAMRLLPSKIKAAIGSGLSPLSIAGVSSICRDALSEARGVPADDAEVAQLVSLEGLPIAERLLRHRMLGWAAELCQERSWRLHIYGKGWETHPTLARFARGPLAHDANLAACYRAARLHLHTGMGGVHHQRVMECALAGGCTLVETKAVDLRILDWSTRNEIAADLQRAGTPIDSPVAIADHWQAMTLRSLSDRMGLDTSGDRDGLLAINAATRREPWAEGRSIATTFTGAWMLGDIASSSFWSRDTFRSAAINLVESDARRDSLSAWQRRATMSSFTYDAFVTRLIDLVRDSLCPGVARG
jgi:hypothetical protein